MHGNEYNKKKFYWMKLDRHYFKNARIKKLRKLAGGDTLTIIYLELCLLSIDNDCCLVYEGIEDSLEEELALKIDEDVENIKLCMAYLRNQGMITECDDHDVQLLNLNVGSETQANVYKKEQKAKLGYTRSNQILTTFEPNSNQILTPSNQFLTEIEKEKELELEKDIELDTEKEKEKELKEKNVGLSCKKLENYFNRPLTSTDYSIIENWYDKYDTELINRCIDYSISKSCKNIHYIDVVVFAESSKKKEEQKENKVDESKIEELKNLL